MSFELSRNGVNPRWMSLDYNDSGYDLLSRVSHEDASPLAVEVKTSTQPWATALFYVSRHEWEVLSSQEHAVLHLWSIARRPYQHAIVSIPNLFRHMALDQGEGKWQNLACPYREWHPVELEHQEARAAVPIKS
jgi:hypothetical protein